MSIKIMDMVADRIIGSTDKKPNGKQTEKNVLMAMANYASDNGEGVWASNQSIADRAGVSRETASRAINSLVENGLISRVGIRRIGMTHTVNYTVNLTVLYRLKMTETAQNHLERMQESDVTERHNGGERCDADTKSDVTERHTNRPRNHLEEEEDARAREKPEPLVDRVRQAYDWLARKHGLPAIKVFGPSRQRLIAARLKDSGGDENLLFEAIRKVADSDYCRGRVNGWKADFEFIFSPKGFAKILEGKYDNDRNSRTETPNYDCDNRPSSGRRASNAVDAIGDRRRAAGSRVLERFENAGLAP